MVNDSELCIYFAKQSLWEEVSELLPHMKGMENVGVAPGEPLGRDLAPLHLVYLLVHPAPLAPHLHRSHVIISKIENLQFQKL